LAISWCATSTASIREHDMRDAALVVLLVAACGARTAGPQPIAWDREPCGHCRMLVGDKAYAAQAIGSDGRATSFDDPGCLLAWLGEGRQAKELWLHHLREDRWLRAPAVAFVVTERSPMGYRLGAVDPGTPSALAWDEARRRASTRRMP
jgi:copper chaperone NosL